MDLTLIIPAKEEEYSLPLVLDEIKEMNLNKIVVIAKDDQKTLNATKNYDCEVLYQTGKGYGNAIIEGIQKTKSTYVCIFYADGSTDPKYLKEMYDKIKTTQEDLIFCSRYEKGAGSDDDGFITKVGNFLFTLIGNIFFSLNITDILFTYIIAKKSSFDLMKLSSNNVDLCAEIPIKAKRLGLKYSTFPSHERKRFGGKKKLKAFRDGLKILFYMIKSF